MKKNCFLFLTLLCTCFCNGQQVFSLDDDQTHIDSLKTVINASKSDSVKVILNLKLSNIYRRYKQPGLSDSHFAEAKKHIKNNAFLKDYILYFDAIQLLSKNDYEGFDKGLINANNRLKKYAYPEAYRLRAMILSNHSLMQQLFNNEQKAIKIIIDEAIPAAIKSKDNELIGSLYKSLGIIFMNYPDRTKANKYLAEALIHLEKANKMSPTLKENIVETRIIHSENLIGLQHYNLAKNHLEKAYAILKHYPNSNLNSIYYQSEGLYFHNNKEYEKAILSFKKGIENTLVHNGIFTRFRLQFAMHQSYMALKQYNKSKNILIELLANNTSIKNDQKEYMKDLAFVYEKLGETNKSNQYYKAYIKLNDSLSAVTHKREIIEQEAKFNKSQNENKIRQLQSQKVKAELLAKNDKLQNAIMALTVGVLAVLLILVLFYLRNKNRLASERELKNRQKINLLKNQKEVEVMQAMIDGEELERKRIARELHDGISSKLSALKIMLTRLETNAANQEGLLRINELLGNSINELRQVSYNLVPESLLSLGLENALTDLCHLFHSDAVKIEFQSFGISQNIAVSSQINIYRMVQELINNALKHSGCTEILVSCSQNEDTFYISVEDNGNGFVIDCTDSKPGLGLKNLKSRVELLDGTLNLESNSSGTYYNIELKVGS